MTLETLLDEALKLSPQDRLTMIQVLASSLHEEQSTAPPTYTNEEIQNFLKIEPLSPEEIIARGLLGGWADLEIQDGAEWVN